MTLLSFLLPLVSLALEKFLFPIYPLDFYIGYNAYIRRVIISPDR